MPHQGKYTLTSPWLYKSNRAPAPNAHCTTISVCIQAITRSDNGCATLFYYSRGRGLCLYEEVCVGLCDWLLDLQEEDRIHEGSTEITCEVQCFESKYWEDVISSRNWAAGLHVLLRVQPLIDFAAESPEVG